MRPSLPQNQDGCGPVDIRLRLEMEKAFSSEGKGEAREDEAQRAEIVGRPILAAAAFLRGAVRE